MIYDLVSHANTYLFPAALDVPSPSSVTELRFIKSFREPLKHFSDQRGLIEKIILVTSFIFMCMVKLFVFACNPGLAFIGLVGGAISDETMRSMDRLKLVWYKTSWPSCLLFTAGALLVAPTVVSVISFLWAAEIGSERYQNARA